MCGRGPNVDISPKGTAEWLKKPRHELASFRREVTLGIWIDAAEAITTATLGKFFGAITHSDINT